MIQTIIFDADDTLWHNEVLFTSTHGLFCELLLPYHERSWIEERLFETEVNNLEIFGYGIKGFMLSMIETAIELTEGRITGTEIEKIIEMGKEMLRAPVEPLPGVRETLTSLRPDYDLMVITKGDLLDQESKVARSGLGDFFELVEVVSEKKTEVYADLFKRRQLDPSTLMMVGNSLKSDVLPLLPLGVEAVHIPYETTWEHERVPEDALLDTHFHRLERMSELPNLLKQLRA